MEKEISKENIEIFGLLFNAAGALVLAIAIASGGGYVESGISGNHYYYTILSPSAFRLGLSLLILGYVGQILGKNMTKNTSVTTIDFVFYCLYGMTITYKILELIQNKFLFI